MNNLIFLKTKKVLILLIFSSLTSCGINEELQPVINPTPIGKGDLYGAGREGIPQQSIFISDTSVWNELMNKMNSVNNVTNGFSETEIDFSKYLILAAFSEVRPSGGYSIKIKNVIETSCCITTTIENTIPGGVVTPVITQPFHIVKIPKTSKQIVFN